MLQSSIDHLLVRRNNIFKLFFIILELLENYAKKIHIIFFIAVFSRQYDFMLQ